MTEYFFEAPTPEEMGATYDGMSFEEFKLLDDEAVDELRLTGRVEWWAACKDFTMDDDEWWTARDKTGIFHEFSAWRKHGVPDRSITQDEFLERMYHYADTRRAKNPTYGQLDESDFAHLTEDEMELTNWVIDEAWDDGNSFVGQPTIRAGGSITHVINRLGVSLDTLVEKDILETYVTPAGIAFNEGTGYVLAGKLAMYLFATRYPEPSS